MFYRSAILLGCVTFKCGTFGGKLNSFIEEDDVPAYEATELDFLEDEDENSYDQVESSEYNDLNNDLNDSFEFDIDREARGDNVVRPKTINEFDRLVDDAAGVWAVSYFYRPTCGPCNKIKPAWRQITITWNLHKKRSRTMPYVHFIEVNRTDSPEIFEKYRGDNIFVPYFVFFKDGKVIYRCQTSDSAVLKKIMQKCFRAKNQKSW